MRFLFGAGYVLAFPGLVVLTVGRCVFDVGSILKLPGMILIASGMVVALPGLVLCGLGNFIEKRRLKREEQETDGTRSGFRRGEAKALDEALTRVRVLLGKKTATRNWRPKIGNSTPRIKKKDTKLFWFGDSPAATGAPTATPAATGASIASPDVNFRRFL